MRGKSSAMLVLLHMSIMDDNLLWYQYASNINVQSQQVNRHMLICQNISLAKQKHNSSSGWKNQNNKQNHKALIISQTASLSAMTRNGDSSTTLGSQFQCMSTSSMKKFFPTSNLNRSVLSLSS